MKVNDKAVEYWNTEAFALLDCLSVRQSTPEPANPKEDIGSLSEQEPILKFSFVKNYIRQHGNVIEQSFDGKLIAFDDEQGKRFQKFVSNIHKDHEIRSCISRDFIHSTSWEWLAKTKNEGRAESNFSNFLISEMENSIKTFKLYFPIVYLNIDVPFLIGNVEFGFFTSEYFDKYIDEYSKHKPNEPNIYIDIRKTYKGLVYAACTVTAEADKGKEIGLKRCSLSMDILKICSSTLDYPFANIDFDIDSRSNINPQSEIIIESSQSADGFSTSLQRPTYPYHLDKAQFDFMKKRGLDTFHNFILGLQAHTSELETLIVQGIVRLARALTNTNHYQRIAELFTILESLLLLNEDSPIIDTVSKYTSKLVTKDKDQRKIIIKFLKEMYGVRSNWIHHAKEKRFEMDDLRKLQKIVQFLLIRLIDKAKLHKVKQTLLDEIDDAILGAY